MAKVDFYNELERYLRVLVVNPDGITSLEDVMDYNIKHTLVEGGVPRTHPAWPTGQDNFDKSASTMGIAYGIYHSALDYIRRTLREEGIGNALGADSGMFGGLVVPIQADDGVAMQIAAQAGETPLNCLFARLAHVLTDWVAR